MPPKSSFKLPKLYKVMPSGRINEWSIEIYYTNKRNKQKKSFKDTELNSNLSKFNESKHVVVLLSCSGILNGKLKKTFRVIDQAKSKPTILEQGKFIMKSIYNRHINRGGYSSNLKEQLKNRSESNKRIDGKIVKIKKFVEVMTPKWYEKLFLERNKDLPYDKEDFGVQAKIDGERITIRLGNSKESKYDFRSRKNTKFYHLDHFNKELDLLKLKPTEIIDGELIKGEASLQSIQRIASLKSFSKDKLDLEILVFDYYDETRPNLHFIERYNILKKKFADAKKKRKLTKIGLLKVFRVKSHKEIVKYHNKFVAKGLEGIIIRYLNKPYYQGRSSWVLKWKYFKELDAKIVGFTSGKAGKADENALIWICQIKSNGKKFKVTPTGSKEARKVLYNKLVNDPKYRKLYIGKILQVKYQGFTDDGVPKFATSGIEPKVVAV